MSSFRQTPVCLFISQGMGLPQCADEVRRQLLWISWFLLPLWVLVNQLRFGVKCHYLLAYPWLALFYSFLSSFSYKHFILTLSSKCVCYDLQAGNANGEGHCLFQVKLVLVQDQPIGMAALGLVPFAPVTPRLRLPSTQIFFEISWACSVTSGWNGLKIFRHLDIANK